MNRLHTTGYTPAAQTDVRATLARARQQLLTEPPRTTLQVPMRCIGTACPRDPLGALTRLHDLPELSTDFDDQLASAAWGGALVVVGLMLVAALAALAVALLG